MTAQHIINSLEFARKKLEIHGTIENSQLLRARDLMSSHAGIIEWSLSGSVGLDGKSKLTLLIKGVVQMPCQRCLESVSVDLNLKSKFILVRDDSEIPSEDDDVDEYDYLVADAEMDVLALVEDEVLLTLPYAPKHRVEDCSVKSEQLETKAPNPFAALRDFKVVKK
ncbi:MAG: hypothetical protein RIR20_486 [Pseudomonadota bacterium]|jgi:uncharacterized protein